MPREGLQGFIDERIVSDAPKVAAVVGAGEVLKEAAIGSGEVLKAVLNNPDMLAAASSAVERVQHLSPDEKGVLLMGGVVACVGLAAGANMVWKKLPQSWREELAVRIPVVKRSNTLKKFMGVGTETESELTEGAQQTREQMRQRTAEAEAEARAKNERAERAEEAKRRYTSGKSGLSTRLAKQPSPEEANE